MLTELPREPREVCISSVLIKKMVAFCPFLPLQWHSFRPNSNQPSQTKSNPTKPNPIQLYQIQPNPTLPNPTQHNPTKPNPTTQPTKPNPTSQTKPKSTKTYTQFARTKPTNHSPATQHQTQLSQALRSACKDNTFLKEPEESLGFPSGSPKSLAKPFHMARFFSRNNSL